MYTLPEVGSQQNGQNYTLLLEGDICKRLPMDDLGNNRHPLTPNVVKGVWSIMNYPLPPRHKGGEQIWGHKGGEQIWSPWTGVSIQPTVQWKAFLGMDFIPSHDRQGVTYLPNPQFLIMS